MVKRSTYILDLKWSRIYALLKRSKTKGLPIEVVPSIGNIFLTSNNRRIKMVKVIFNHNNTPVAVVRAFRFLRLLKAGKVDRLGYTTDKWDGLLN